MYPYKFNTAMVKNRWYIAAFSNEITRNPIERTFLGLPVALYRKQDGSPVAMYGLCPHRYFPLADSKVVGDAIKCGYHGFTFDADGSCTDIPSQDRTSNFCQPTYPIIERGPLCWIWMGDKDLCDTVDIPPYEDFGLEQPGWHYGSENYFHAKARSHLLIDNLMDLSHVAYIHEQLKGGDALAKIPLEEGDRPHSYQVLRKDKGPWNPFLEKIFGIDIKFEGLHDFTTVCDFYGPEFIRTSMRILKSLSVGEAIPNNLMQMYIAHGLTPETETTTHYFGFATRNFKLGDTELDEYWLASDTEVRQQDVVAVDKIEKRLEFGAARQRELLAKADSAAMRVRKRIELMLAQENK